MMRLFILLVGALLAAVALMAATAHAQSETRVLGGLYEGLFDGQGEGCGTGSVRAGPETGLDVDREGTRIIGLLVNDLVSPLGDFDSLMIPIDVPIGDDGSFDSTFDPLNLGVTIIHLDGRFDGESVSGNFSTTPTGEPGCAGTFTMDWTPPPPQIYSGSIESAERNCGNGGILVTVSGDGLSVIGLEIEEFKVHGAATSGSATFAEGTVPIAEDGSFGWAYFPGSEPGQEIAVIGAVRFATISGAVTFSPSTCGAVPFVSVNPSSLGFGGTGPIYDSGIAPGWALAAGAFGIAGLAVGAAVRRRAR